MNQSFDQSLGIVGGAFGVGLATCVSDALEHEVASFVQLRGEDTELKQTSMLMHELAQEFFPMLGTPADSEGQFGYIARRVVHDDDNFLHLARGEQHLPVKS